MHLSSWVISSERAAPTFKMKKINKCGSNDLQLPMYSRKDSKNDSNLGAKHAAASHLVSSAASLDLRSVWTKPICKITTPYGLQTGFLLSAVVYKTARRWGHSWRPCSTKVRSRECVPDEEALADSDLSLLISYYVLRQRCRRWGWVYERIRPFRGSY